MACAMVAQASDLRRSAPGLDRHHAGVAENQSREIASSASDKFAPSDTRPKRSPGKPGRRRNVRRRHSSRQGIVTEGEDPSGASEAAAGGA
jgi:hypothetical protein